MRANATQSSKPLVVIVDDDQSIRLAIERLIRSIGFRAGSFASGEQFLAADRLEEIDCIILDIKLGGMDGLAVQSQLAATNPRIPIIFLTAAQDEKVRVQTLQLGAVAFLPKPCDEKALLHAVDRALKEGEPASRELPPSEESGKR
jgi:FixJ family two-component response regulator